VLGAHDHGQLWMKPRKQMYQEGKLPCTWPPPKQIRAMNYMALAGGATGIIWYWAPCRSPAWSKQKTPMKWYNLPKDAPVVWKTLVDVNAEMTRLMPWLTAEKRSDDTVKVGKPFAAWSRRVGDRRIVIAVNLISKPAELNLDLSEFRPKRITNWGDRASISTQPGVIKAKYSGYEVGIYELAL